MKNISFSKESNGQAFSLDLMLGFIILTVIIGISADAMDMASYKMQDYSSRKSLDRLTIDAADILVKSSGSPQNWEKYGINQATIPGLAVMDIQSDKTVPNTLSITKINKLKENYPNLIYSRILPLGVNSSMIIYPSNDSFAPLFIINNTPPANVWDIAVANRTVLLDFMHLKVAIYDNTYGNVSAEKCANPEHKLDNSSFDKLNWSCCCFNIARDELDSSDFYLVGNGNISSSSGWILVKASCQNDTVNKFSPNPVLLNDKITEWMGYGNKTVLWLHMITEEDADHSYGCYIVSVPKGTPPEMINLDYLDTGPWFFVLQVWR